MYEQIVAWWQTKNIQTDADLEEAFNGHVISFAYNSGNIENPNVTYHDTREIFEHDGVRAIREIVAPYLKFAMQNWQMNIFLKPLKSASLSMKG